MKKNLVFKQWMMNLALVALSAGMGLLMGCASTSTTSNPSTSGSKVAPLPAGVTLHKDEDIQGVWLAPGFNFKGYEALYIPEPVFAAMERPNEAAMRAMTIRYLPEQLAQNLRDTKLFATVTTRREDLKPEAKSLQMQTTIIEYEKGGGGARYFAGAFGGGQPVIKVRGQILDGEKLMCVYEIKRSGESAGARLVGHFLSDEEIQQVDIRDLAGDLANFFRRTAKAH